MGYMTSTYSMLISALVATQDTLLPPLYLSTQSTDTLFSASKEYVDYKKLYENAVSELNYLSKEIEESYHLKRRLDGLFPSPKTYIKWLPTCGAALGAKYQADPMYLNDGNDFKCSDFPNLPDTCPSRHQQKS